VLEELGTKIDISTHDAVKELEAHTLSIHVEEVRLEEHLRSKITLLADADSAAVRDGDGIDKSSGLSGKLLLNLEIIADIAELLLDLTDSLKVRSAVEGITTEKKKLDEVTGDVRTGNIKTTDKVHHGVTLADRDDVSNTITRVEHNTIKKTLGIKHKNSLDGNIGTIETVLLEHHLDHLLTVLLRVQRSLGKKDLAVPGIDVETLMESVVPQVLHVLPAADDTVVKRIRDLELATGNGSLITNHDILELDLADLLLATEDGTTNHGREDRSREVSTGKTSLDETRTVVAHDSVLTSPPAHNYC